IMKKQFQFFAGIDVSKLKLDVCICNEDPGWFEHQVFSNHSKGIRQMIKWLKKWITDSSVLFCLEHTGIYAMPVCCYLSEQQMDYCLVPAIVIQKSLGLKRGKNDKADSK